MFREFFILLCAGTYVSSIAVQSGTQTAPVQFQASGGAQRQDRLALPSQNSYQNVAAPANSVPSYQVSPAVVNTISQAKSANSVPAQSYGSPNVQQPAVTISASVAADPSSPEYNNILERYAPAVEPIKPYFAVPVAAKTVSVGSQAAGNVGQGAQAGNNGYMTRPYVVYNNAVQQGQYYGVPAQRLVESQKSINVPPPPNQGNQNGAPAVAYSTISGPSTPRPFYPPSTAILEAHGEFIEQSPTLASYKVNQINQVNQATQVNQVNQANQFNQVNQANQFNQVNQANQFNQVNQAPQVNQVNQLTQVKQVQAPPQPQYIPAPKITYNVKPAVQLQTVSVPVAPKKVSIEAYNSVQTHPPSAVRYAPAPAPIPVPVLFQEVEANPSPAPQFVLTKTLVPTTAPYAQVPIEFEPVSVPVYATSGARLQYLPIPVTGGHQNGYAKAVLFSPASEVSRVIFNGLGVSYGW